ncbi:Peroxisomal acyl-coenzyme A thioester hydrolase 1 [Spathaspora sp. JA1]|nr:Peroxisomal acyl-coenzyme A thioester hydrolase 1 [Spathaspora sp. JA1]
MIQDFVAEGPFPQNSPIDVQEIYGVTETSPNKYRGNYPLQKPIDAARGAYGGNLAAQAVVVAIKSSPEGFRPHALHSFFIKAVNDKEVVDWEVEQVSNGRTFANRSIKGLQNGEIVYTATVSLTKKNSHKEDWKKYEQTGKETDKPFEWSTPQHDWFEKHKLDNVPGGAANSRLLFYHKIFPELISLDLTKAEEQIPIGERKLSYYVKWGIENEHGYNQPLINVDQDYQYVGLASLSDSIFLTRLLRLLRIEDADHTNLIHYFSVSLDHTIYFHDDDFDVTKWMGFSFRAAKCTHNRVLIEGEMYNDKGKHVASIVQEGLVQFNGRESATSTQVIPIDIASELGVTQLGPNRYQGNKPLLKPDSKNRGVYGGSLCAQAILVAIKSSPDGFRPHSLHSYFVKSVDDLAPVVWEVTEISNGRNFVNRMLNGIQYDKVVYTANISLTRKNSSKDFTFQTPSDERFTQENRENLPIFEANPNLYLYLKAFPQETDLPYDPNRKLSYMVKWGIDNEQGRISHNRALVQGEIYSESGLHVASIVQERLFLVGGRNARSKPKMSDFNYKRGEAIDVRREFGVRYLAKDRYCGVKPLVRPAPDSRGVFGGNLAGQAILVAIKSSPSGFKPHSLHSFFVRAANDQEVVNWEVEEVSNGNNFVNRSVRGFQSGVMVYIANISLTKRNSHKEAKQKYDDFVIEQKARESEKAKDADGEDNEDDDDSEPAPPKPFVFQTPYHDWFKKYNIDQLPVSDHESNLLIYHKILPEFTSLNLTPEEETVGVTDRRLSFLVKWGINQEQGFNQPLINVDDKFQFVGLANLSDSMYLDTLLRILRVKDLDLSKKHEYFSVSLDHSIYFHDDDFDVTQWIGFSYKAIRFAHNRVVIEGEMYNDKGIHIATIVQEGLVQFNGTERGAKL